MSTSKTKKSKPGKPPALRPDTKAIERRNRGLNDLATTIEQIYGPRCSRAEGGCHTCATWAIFDALSQLTDSTLLKPLN